MCWRFTFTLFLGCILSIYCFYVYTYESYELQTMLTEFWAILPHPPYVDTFTKYLLLSKVNISTFQQPFSPLLAYVVFTRPLCDWKAQDILCKVILKWQLFENVQAHLNVFKEPHVSFYFTCPIICRFSLNMNKSNYNILSHSECTDAQIRHSCEFTLINCDLWFGSENNHSSYYGNQ